MTRVKRRKTSHKKREKILKQAKGFKWGRKSKKRSAKEALVKAYTYAFVGRKLKKRDFRKLWQVKINAALRQLDSKYSTFMHAIKEKGVEVDRKILAEIAEHYPDLFKMLVKEIEIVKEDVKKETKSKEKKEEKPKKEKEEEK